MTGVALAVDRISKSFPGVRALDDVSFEVRRGSVHALCGENGAGKSTLMKIIDGIYQPDDGEIRVAGQAVKIRNPIHARSFGIAMISQELDYVPDMTIAESFFMGRLPANLGRINWSFIYKEAAKILQAEGLDYRLSRRLGTLTVSEIQMLQILRAVYHSADVLIMDEPTSAIAHREVESLLAKIRKLRADGKAIIYISHKMDEVFTIADEITVLRDGKAVSTKPASESSTSQVISDMVGRQLDHRAYPERQVEIGEPALRVKGLARVDTFEDISFEVRAGEIVGLAGLIGAGRSEVVRAVFGLDRFNAGDIEISGKRVRIKSPRAAIRHGLALLSEDRRLQGIIPQLSIKENATVASLKKVVRGGFARRRFEKQLVSEQFARLRVKAPSTETMISNLSGGNQQKVLLARWLIAKPKVFLLDEPTRGVDVGAKFEIYKIMSDVAAEGVGVVMISSELPELIGMCDRIYVMAGGRITAVLQPEQYSQETILTHAMNES